MSNAGDTPTLGRPSLCRNFIGDIVVFQLPTSQEHLQIIVRDTLMDVERGPNKFRYFGQVYLCNYDIRRGTSRIVLISVMLSIQFVSK